MLSEAFCKFTRNDLGYYIPVNSTQYEETPAAGKDCTDISLVNFPFAIQPGSDKHGLNQFNRISDMFRAMMQRSNDDAFIIIECPPHTGFVQACATEKDTILIDIQFSYLPDNLKRDVEGYLRTLTTYEKGQSLLKDAGGVPAKEPCSVYLETPNDPELATGIVLDILYDIFKIPTEILLHVTEN